MATYSVECNCGHDVKVDASNSDDAVRVAKQMMDKDAIAKHFRRYHFGEFVPSVSEMHAHIEQDIRETVAA